MNELNPREISEKHRAIEQIIDYTISDSICWKKTGHKYTAVFINNLINNLEFESFSYSTKDSLPMSKLVIRNENGEIAIYNGDITLDLHRRLLSAINYQTESSKVLQDFI